MAWTGTVTAKLTNSDVSADNYQLVNFDFDSAAAFEDDLAAAVIAYLASCGASDAIAGATGIVEVTTREAGDPGGIPRLFPGSAYTALLGTATPPPTPGVMAFPMGIGSGALCPLGTSISVSERSGFAGPHGRGRHFLPFTGEDCVDPSGHLAPGVAALIETYYDQFIMGTAIGTLNVPVVRPGNTYTGGHPITLVRAQPIFSNLESRRR